MKRQPSSTTDQYYVISNPRFENEHSGLFCIKKRFIENFNKDFLFDYTNPYTKKHETKVLDKNYVLQHISMKCPPKFLSLTLNLESRYEYCYFISYEDVKKAA